MQAYMGRKEDSMMAYVTQKRAMATLLQNQQKVEEGRKAMRERVAGLGDARKKRKCEGSTTPARAMAKTAVPMTVTAAGERLV